MSWPDLLSAGPCSEKMWGVRALQLGRYFSWIKTGDLFSHHRVSAATFPNKTGDLFWLVTLLSHGSRPFFRHAKNYRSFYEGPLLWGGAVRPNMLNMLCNNLQVWDGMM